MNHLVWAYQKTEMTKTRILLFLFLYFFTFQVFAQSDDFATRIGIEIKKDFKKGFDLSVEYQYRRNQNLSQFQASFISISPSYKFNKHFNTSAEIRYGTSKTWDRFRYAYYLTAKNTSNKFGYSFRVGYLYENFLQEVNDIEQFPSTHSMRIRLLTDYKINKKIKIALSSEPILSLDNNFNIRQMRNIIELDYDIFKRQVFSISYLNMPQFTSNIYTSSNHIIQLKYAFTITKNNNF